MYILAAKYNKLLYTGVTNDLKRRVYEHKSGIEKGFSKKYNVNKLVYYEKFDSITQAISREKQIKGGSREKKVELIEKMNPGWKDMYDEL